MMSIVVAGAAGGVGTTTVTAIITALLTMDGQEVELGDHTSGRLDHRLAEPGEKLHLQSQDWAFPANPHQDDSTYRVIDAGRFTDESYATLESRANRLCIVTSVGFPEALATKTIMDSLAGRFGADVFARVLIVMNEAHRVSSTDRRRAETLLTANTRLPYLAGCAAQGRISIPLLNADKKAQASITDLARELHKVLYQDATNSAPATF